MARMDLFEAIDRQTLGGHRRILDLILLATRLLEPPEIGLHIHSSWDIALPEVSSQPLFPP